MAYKKTVKSIVKLYQTKGAAAGGYGHIVFDDGNIEDGHIDWCIEEFGEEDKYKLGEACRLASLEALILIKKVPYGKREKVIEKAFGMIMNH